jgi:hypothetical protein
MKKACFAGLIVIAILAVVLPTQCRKPSYRQIPLDHLIKMPPFKAKVEGAFLPSVALTNVGTFALIALKTDDGRRVCFGWDNPSPEQIAFIQSFKRGQTYTFPAAFLDYTNSKEEKK